MGKLNLNIKPTIFFMKQQKNTLMRSEPKFCIPESFFNTCSFAAWNMVSFYDIVFDWLRLIKYLHLKEYKNIFSS